MTTKYKQLMVRMKYNTFKRIETMFPAYKDESMAHYFQRLAEYMEEGVNY